MAEPRSIVTLTTDFGTADTFVGEMKGAALAVHPGLTIVDLTHEVPPQDVAAASYLLSVSYRAFPRGTIHVAVVDPGVGTSRKALAVETASCFLVAPDNGVLTGVMDRETVLAVHAITEPAYRRDTVSATFEGRDVFAPAAAWIARGTAPSEMGPSVGEPVRLHDRRPDVRPGAPVHVPVLIVDRFGNATLDLPGEILAPLLRRGDSEAGFRIVTPGGVVDRFCRTYAEGEAGVPFALFNSAGYLEIAVRGGNAARTLGLAAGEKVEFLLE